jgi:hypothetical protein
MMTTLLGREGKRSTRRMNGRRKGLSGRRKKVQERNVARPGWPVLDRRHKCGKALVTRRGCLAPLDVMDRWRRPLVSGSAVGSGRHLQPTKVYLCRLAIRPYPLLVLLSPDHDGFLRSAGFLSSPFRAVLREGARPSHICIDNCMIKVGVISIARLWSGWSVDCQTLFKARKTWERTTC